MLKLFYIISFSQVKGKPVYPKFMTQFIFSRGASLLSKPHLTAALHHEPGNSAKQLCKINDVI
jgi:hypothetical protein